jgi:hypothetical protein
MSALDRCWRAVVVAAAWRQREGRHEPLGLVSGARHRVGPVVVSPTGGEGKVFVGPVGGEGSPLVRRQWLLYTQIYNRAQT